MTLILESPQGPIVPVRAIPFLTGGTLAPADLAGLFYDPESCAGSEAPDPMHSFRSESGQIIRIKASEWKRSRDALREANAGDPCELGKVRRLLPGALVRLDQLRELYAFLQSKAAESEALGFRVAPAGEWGWNETPHLDEDEKACVWEAITVVRPAVVREQRNSRHRLLEALKAAIEAIITEANAAGVEAAREEMPGIKADLIKVLQARERRWKGRADSTLTDDFAELGLRWRGGRNRSDRAPFLRVFELEPDA